MMTPTSQSGSPHGSTSNDPVLAVDGLAVEFGTPFGVARVIEDVSVTIAAGETLGLVGESGSGKTVTAMAALGMIAPPNGRVVAGSVRLNGRDILGLGRRELTAIRGNEIGMVFQEPRRNLDPAFTIGDQIAETVRAHRRTSRKESKTIAIELLERVGIPAPRRRADDYPHEFSGGMAQRAMLAIALAGEPSVLIADEPTTALDVTVQAKVLDLIRDLQRELGLAVLFISHDLGVIAESCDRVAVMYAGQIVEQGGATDVFLRPRHPYTAALLASVPHREAGGVRMASIPGVVPAAHDWPAGCRFHARCRYAIPRCSDEVPELTTTRARCLLANELTLGGIR